MNSTLILSDTHIGSVFFEKRCRALCDLISKFDQIILNGDFLDDFWDYEKTIHSSWFELFTILKDKKVIYLFGNHDRDTDEIRRATEDFVDIYSDSYSISVADKELYIMHGHTIYPRPDGILYEEQKTSMGKIMQKIARSIWRWLYPLILKIRFIIEQYPKTLAKLQRPIIQHQNERMKEYAKKHLLPHQILVCGHSHYREDAREEQFINTGANCYERLEYVSIIDAEIKLKTQDL